MIIRPVLHVISTIERGGAENAVLALANAQVKAGYEVIVFPLKGSPELENDFKSKGVTVHGKALNVHPLRQVLMLRTLLKAREPIVHAHLPRAEIIAKLAIGRDRFVVTRHNSEKFFPNVSRFISSFISRWVTKNATVVAISKAVLCYLRDNMELHQNNFPIVIHYGYVPCNNYLNRKSFFTPNESKTLRIGTISRLVPQKNLKLLINLTANLNRSNYDVETSIVGGGPLKEELTLYADALGVKDRVHFLGRTKQIMDYLLQIDLFVLTSNYEGFGLVLLEAIDSGLPIVAPNNSSIPEVLGADHPGLFETNSLEALLDKVQDLMTSPKCYSDLVNSQLERLDHFSIESYRIRHEEIYFQNCS